MTEVQTKVQKAIDEPVETIVTFALTKNRLTNDFNTVEHAAGLATKAVVES